MFFRLSFALTAFAVATPAYAAIGMFVSDAVEYEEGIVAHVASIDTSCHTFAIDEDANRSATYRTLVSVEEVLVWPEWAEGEPLVAGESIELEWKAWTPIEQDEPEYDGCGNVPELNLSSGDQRWLVLLPGGDGVFFADTMYQEDIGERVEGDGILPTCGEDEQVAVYEALTEGPLEDANVDENDALEDESVLAEDGDGADVAPAGCTVLPLSGVGPAAALLGLIGLVRRRRR